MCSTKEYNMSESTDLNAGTEQMKVNVENVVLAVSQCLLEREMRVSV